MIGAGFCGAAEGRIRLACVPVALTGCVVLLSAAAAIAADKTSTNVTARYDIAYSGIRIGHFQFNSSLNGKRYVLSSDSRVKLLFGAFKWASNTRTTGTITSVTAPKSFRFDYWIRKKHKQSSVTFAGGRVAKLENSPRINNSSKYVRLQPQHLVGVVDPMTAIMNMSRASTAHPCRQSAEIFDGRRRMRLSLSPKGRRRISERKPSGQPALGFVCRIRFTPIAGHKKSNNINYISRNNDIEIVLRPVPSADLLVPIAINIPTALGTVSMVARSVNIVGGRNLRIAMVY